MKVYKVNIYGFRREKEDGKKQKQNNNKAFKVEICFWEPYMWNDGCLILFWKPVVLNISLVIDIVWWSDQSYWFFDCMLQMTYADL